MNESISQKLIGRRIKAARETAGWTQEALTHKLGLNDRQSLSDIENGKRIVKPNELLALSHILEQDIEFFIDPFVVAGEAQFSWRASPEATKNYLVNFELQAGQWIGLLRFLRSQQSSQKSVLKKSLRLTANSSFEDAQACGENLATEMELGTIPANTLVDKIEEIFDIPVLFVNIKNSIKKDNISGATCHLDEMTAIIINRHECEARRSFDIAHELFHALTWDTMKPAHYESNDINTSNKGSRIEKLADNFAASLLMPRHTLDRLIKLNDLQNLNRLGQIATELRVSLQALAWRLYNLKLIEDDILKKLMAMKQPSTSNIPKLFSHIFVKMLHEALENGRLSARKAAKVTGFDLAELTELFTEYKLTPPFEL